jgi:hypothetical protein
MPISLMSLLATTAATIAVQESVAANSPMAIDGNFGPVSAPEVRQAVAANHR